MIVLKKIFKNLISKLTSFKDKIQDRRNDANNNLREFNDSVSAIIQEMKETKLDIDASIQHTIDSLTKNFKNNSA